MSWLRSSPLRQSLNRSSSGSNNSALLKQNNIDAAACFDSFRKHWQQAYEIIQKSEENKPPNHDDVLGVVSHLDYMVTLLLVELHNCNKITISNQTPPAPCLEFLLSENLLNKLYEWSIQTGRYSEAVRLEQLKLYELLVSHSRHQLLCHEPFLKPLLKILASSEGEIFKPDIEKRLVILLNQLCVVLMQNVHLLDLFFFSSNQHGQGSNSTNFIIFSLLIPFVHREGSIGHQARDALLLCMALSQKNSNIGTYISKYSSMCPLLVTGLGGLYSRLPSIIEINSIDWCRITPDDVTEIPELTLFMNSLEFCNAVVQVAHDLIKEQLLDFMYQGFIVPVLGPSILQIFKASTTNLQTNIESQISAIAYLDLILRSVTEPGLLKNFVKFLLDDEKFDGQRIIDVLIERLTTTDPNLCMVTISLFDTLLGLYCEDISLELFLKFLVPGKHIPISSRHKVNKINPYLNSVNFFLDLAPEVMKHLHHNLRKTTDVSIQQDHFSLSKHDNQQQQQQKFNIGWPQPVVSKTIGASWNHYGLNSSVENISLYSNFNAYLFEAHFKIEQARNACEKWSNRYKYQKWTKIAGNACNQNFEKLTEMVKNFIIEFSMPVGKSTISTTDAQMYDCDKNKFDTGSEPLSIGESSGYESFKWRPYDDDGNELAGALQATSASDTSDENNLIAHRTSKDNKVEAIWRISVQKDISFLDIDFSEDLFAQGTVTLGPFLNAIWNKLQTFTSNSFYVNLHLTGLITRLAFLPLPLVHSLLLRPDIITTSDIPSFHQILRMMKQQIDVELPHNEESLELIDVARSLLIDREFRLINARKNAVEPKNLGRSVGLPYSYHNQTTFSNISSTTPPQVTASSSYDPFRRNDTKRKSFSKSISNIFGRKSNGSPFSSMNNAVSHNFSQPSSTSVSMFNSNNSSGSSTSTTSFTVQPPTSSISLPNHIPLRDHMSSFSQNSSQSSSSATIVGGSSLTSVGSGSGPNSLESMSSLGAIANSSGTERTRDLALCAVLLDEWLKELAAISQEQSIVMLNDKML